MAGFIETMEQWRRMCEMYSCDDDDYYCVGCPIKELKYDEHGCDAIFSEWAKKADWDAVEEVIHVWAERNPEPVYPTFGEWMYDSFLKWCQENYPGRAKDEKAWFDYIYETHIPSDIAQKLGIEPKEADV